MAVHVLKSPRRQSRPRGLSVPSAQPTRKHQLDHDYWVAHSDGFRVDAANGRLGFVEDIRPDSATSGAVLLLVRAGVLGLRVVVVRSADVAAIVPTAKRIWLYSDAALSTVVKTGIEAVETPTAQVTPSTVTYGTRSITARFHVSACGGSVQGALVYVTAVPYGMFNIPNEQATGADGWATLNFTALAGSRSARTSSCS